jgi:hypothetical protein
MHVPIFAVRTEFHHFFSLQRLSFTSYVTEQAYPGLQEYRATSQIYNMITNGSQWSVPKLKSLTIELALQRHDISLQEFRAANAERLNMLKEACQERGISFETPVSYATSMGTG